MTSIFNNHFYIWTVKIQKDCDCYNNKKLIYGILIYYIKIKIIKQYNCVYSIKHYFISIKIRYKQLKSIILLKQSNLDFVFTTKIPKVGCIKF